MATQPSLINNKLASGEENDQRAGHLTMVGHLAGCYVAPGAFRQIICSSAGPPVPGIAPPSMRVEFAIPLRETSQPLLQHHLGLVPSQCMELGHVGESRCNVARLHRPHNFFRAFPQRLFQ
jgi:hypothetical protein